MLVLFRIAYSIKKGKILPAILVMGKRKKTNSELQHQENIKNGKEMMQKWINSKTHPDRLYRGDARYNCSYWEAYDSTKNW